MSHSRVTIFAGHYGSGKTNIAVNYALYLSETEKRVSLADLDIVNPYFRSKDSEKILADKGIRLISSVYANSNVDTPAIPAEAYSITADRDCHAVVDVGGDDRGALALGRYVPELLKEDNWRMLFVVNKFRPLTSDADSAIEVMREIENSCGLTFSGIVNNSNLGAATDACAVLTSAEYAEEISEKTGIPIAATTVERHIYPQVCGRITGAVPITLYVKQSWSKD